VKSSAEVDDTNWLRIFVRISPGILRYVLKQRLSSIPDWAEQDCKALLIGRVTTIGEAKEIERISEQAKFRIAHWPHMIGGQNKAPDTNLSYDAQCYQYEKGHDVACSGPQESGDFCRHVGCPLLLRVQSQR